MLDLFTKLLTYVRDPNIILIAISFVLILLVVWKLFEKQHAFLMERVDTLVQSNEDLRKQINMLRDENERLRQSTTIISTVARALQSQPQEMEEQIAEVKRLTEQLAIGAPGRPEQLQQLQVLLRDMFERLASLTAEVALVQRTGFARIQEELQRSGPSQDVVRLIHDMSQALLYSQRESSASLDEVAKRAAALLR